MGESITPNIILSTGPMPYLFWTTGVYYLWELSRAYRVSLIVDEDYKDDPLFHRVIKLCSVEEVVYLPNRSNLIARHRFYSKVLRDLVQRHPHAVVLQYNDVYPDNYYLTHFTKRQNNLSKVVIFQVGQIFRDYIADYHARISFAIDSLKLRYGIPSWIAKLLYRVKGEIKHLLDFYLLPLFFSGNAFAPKLKLATGKLIHRNIWKDVNFKLYYKNIEMEMAAEVEGDTNGSSKRILIQHPLETVGRECNAKLYSDHEENLITVLPSYGFVNALISQNSSGEAPIVKEISEKWREVIALFEKNHKGWKIAWKLHPNAAQDRPLQSITSQLQQGFPNMTVMQSSENASRLILRSKIILSDVSNVLWWASFIKGKVPISLDIFRYPGGDGLKGYEGIYYFETISQLETFITELMPQLDATVQYSHISDKPSLTDFLSLLQT